MKKPAAGLYADRTDDRSCDHRPILAAVALPAYQDYTIRAKMSEVILGMSACRTLDHRGVQSVARAGANNWAAEVSAGSARSTVNSISTDANGVVTAVIQSISTSVDGSTVSLTPMTSARQGGLLRQRDVALRLRCRQHGGWPRPCRLSLPGSCRG